MSNFLFRPDLIVKKVNGQDLIPIGKNIDENYITKNISLNDLVDNILEINYPTSLYQWVKKIANGTATAAMDGGALVELNGRIYLLGGWYPVFDPENETNNEVWLFDEDLEGTTQLENAGWSPRHSFGYAYKGNKVWVFGGDLNSGDFQNDSWEGVQNEDLSITWTLKNSNCEFGDRVLFASCIHNDELFVIGGQTNAITNANPKQDVWKSTDGGATWVQIASGLAFLGKNYNGCATSYNGYIYLVAGGEYKTPTENSTYLNTVYRSADGVTWEQMDNAPFDGRQYPSVITHENKLFVLFGNDESNKSDCWTMDLNGYWEQLPLGNIPARHATPAVSFKDKIVIATGNYHNDTWVLIHSEADNLITKDTTQQITGSKTFTQQINAQLGVGFPNGVIENYQDGTWTPVNANVTLTDNVGRFVRIGNIVHLFFTFTFPSNANSGNAEIQGLPFNAGSQVINGASIGFTTDIDNFTIIAINGLLQIYNRSGVLTTNAQNSGKIYSGVCTYRIVDNA